MGSELSAGMASVERQVQTGPLGDGEAEGVYHVSGGAQPPASHHHALSCVPCYPLAPLLCLPIPPQGGGMWGQRQPCQVFSGLHLWSDLEKAHGLYRSCVTKGKL